MAFTEDNDFSDFIEDMFDQETEVVTIKNANEEFRKKYFKPIFELAVLPPDETEKENVSEEVLAVLPIPESRELTEKEEKRLRRKEDTLLRELRIFLRETWQKINREQKFFMFRTPVDTDEVIVFRKHQDATF